MLVDLDKFELLYLIDGCAGGSHLRQHIWKRFVDTWWKDMSDLERETIYTYAKRDSLPKYEPRKYGDGLEYTRCGAKEFKTFLAAYNPANRFVVNAKFKGYKEDNVECFLYDGMYHTSMNTYFHPAAIKEVKQRPFEKCCNSLCMLKDKCARFTEDADVISENGRFTTVFRTGGCDYILDIDELKGYKKVPQSQQEIIDSNKV